MGFGVPTEWEAHRWVDILNVGTAELPPYSICEHVGTRVLSDGKEVVEVRLPTATVGTNTCIKDGMQTGPGHYGRATFSGPCFVRFFEDPNVQAGVSNNTGSQVGAFPGSPAVFSWIPGSTPNAPLAAPQDWRIIAFGPNKQGPISWGPDGNPLPHRLGRLLLVEKGRPTETLPAGMTVYAGHQLHPNLQQPGDDPNDWFEATTISFSTDIHQNPDQPQGVIFRPGIWRGCLEGSVAVLNGSDYEEIENYLYWLRLQMRTRHLQGATGGFRTLWDFRTHTHQRMFDTVNPGAANGVGKAQGRIENIAFLFEVRDGGTELYWRYKGNYRAVHCLGAFSLSVEQV